MLRSKKTVHRPACDDVPIQKQKQLGKFFIALYFGLMCNLFIYQSNYNYNKKELIVFELSDLYDTNSSKNMPFIYSLMVKPVPKPDIFVFSPNTNLTNNITEFKPILEKLLVSSDYNRTESLWLFAKNISRLTHPKNVLIMFREFSGSIELEPVIYYTRPVDEIAEIYIIW